MKKDKKQQKGLSDKELIEKYEAGAQPVLKTIRKMLNTKPQRPVVKPAH